MFFRLDKKKLATMPAIEFIVCFFPSRHSCPDTPIVSSEPFFFCVVNVKQMYRQLVGNWCLCNRNSDKMSAICTNLFRLVDYEISDQILNFCKKIFVTASNFFEN
jgi:hypothetical protein